MITTSLHTIIEGIHAKENIISHELAPFLAVEKIEDRISNNVQIAEAYFKAGELEKACLLIKRAFVLSGFSVDLLAVYEKMYKKLGDPEALKFAYKRIGINLFREGKIETALAWFDKWQYVYAYEQNIDRYDFDYEIINTIDAYCSAYHAKHSSSTSGKIKIGYLPVHFLDPGSVLIKLDKLLVRYHDKNRFEITCFVMQNRSDVHASEYGRTLDQYFKEQGCSMIYMDDNVGQEDSLITFAKTIKRSRQDIFVADAAISTFDHYFIASCRPAPVCVSIVHGPVAQYVTKIFDHAVSSFDVQSLDICCDVTKINIELEQDLETEIYPQKSVDEIEKKKVVLVCGGRVVKFQNRQYWESLFNILKKNENAYLFVVGFAKEKFPFPDLLLSSFLTKIAFYPWTADYQAFFSECDIYVDGYPVGGAVFMIEAMRTGLPVVGFEYNYLEPFKGDKGSGAEEIMGIQSLCASDGNFLDFENKIQSLISNPEHRKSIGEICRKKILTERSNPQRMVQYYEELYAKLRGYRSKNISYRAVIDPVKFLKKKIRPVKKALKKIF